MIATQEKWRELARTALDRWRDDPVRFATEALGVSRIWSKQDELLRAAAVHRKIAVRSGQKTSKTFSIAIIALWWALTRRRARVILLSPSARQIKINIWSELANLRAEAADRREFDAYGTPRTRALMPLGGDWHDSPETGWKFPANRSEIVGFVSNDPERLRGLSGPDQLYIVDEASGVPDEIFSSIDGNLAGGGGLLAISNPVHSNGWYGECFKEGSKWHQIEISSIEASQVDPPIPGLATKAFIEEKRHEWGENSAEWHAKILGRFPPATVDGVISRTLVDRATKDWPPTPQTDDPLQLGVDVARFGGDRSAIAWSRGLWATVAKVLNGSNVVEVSEEVLAVIRAVARPDETVRVLIDAVSIGAGVADILRTHETVELANGGTCVLEVVDVQAAGSSPDQRCSRMRDAIWIAMKEWLEAGGKIPDRPELVSDLTAPTLGYDIANRWKVEDKKSMKQRIGRSTDVADAVTMSVYRAEVATLEWSPAIAHRRHRGM